jgi:pimeloyl-ACP methyl ester carboxylesterase
MFRDLISLLADRFHLIAPDLPGFGQTDMPKRSVFKYTFDNIADVIDRFTEVVGFDRFAIYVFDYGAPTGFRLAAMHSERITAIISQNGNAYEEGLSEGWNPIRALGVEGYPGIWALGDCAMIPDQHGGYQPATAQHASREGKVLAHNIVANRRGEDLIPFRFNTLGLLASIGRRTGVARILGFNFSGFVAWWLWRTIYLLKLPRVEKKVRVALDWTLDVFFTKDFVQYLHQRSTPFVNTPITSSDIGPKTRIRIG